MGVRNYGQFCSLARALDLVGDRWTLLILRDLLAGPRRFKDLLEGLPGIGTNLLAKRLKTLENNGLLQLERLSPQLAVKAYRLTPAGRELEPALVALARWGIRFLKHPRGEDLWRPQWNHLALKARFNSLKAHGLNEVYAFRIDDYPYFIRINSGRLDSGEGTPPDAAFSLKTTAAHFMAVFIENTLELDQALAGGHFELQGSSRAFNRCLTLFQA